MKNLIIGKLFFSKKKGNYYFLVPNNNDSPICFCCEKPISIAITIRQYKEFSNWKMELYCSECIKKVKTNRFQELECKTMALITDKFPKGKMIGVSSLIGGLKDGTGKNAVSVFDVDKLETHQTVDKTKFSGESIGGATIGKKLDYDPLKNKIMNVKESLELLKKMKEAKPYIENDETKILRKITNRARN